jgi:hypothetical protein
MVNGTARTNIYIRTGIIKRIRNILPLKPILLRFKPKLSNPGLGAFSPFVLTGDGLRDLAFAFETVMTWPQDVHLNLVISPSIFSASMSYFFRHFSHTAIIILPPYLLNYANNPTKMLRGS